MILERTCDSLKTRWSDQGGPCIVGAHGLGWWRLYCDIIYLPGFGKQKTTQKTSDRMIHLIDRHEISGSKKRKFVACFILFCCMVVSFDCKEFSPA